MRHRFSSHGHEVSSSRMSHADSSASSTSSNRDSSDRYRHRKDKLNHIKKPLNAFMLYMKEMRAEVQSQCTLKESAAINQILGKRVNDCNICVFRRIQVCTALPSLQWHALDRQEQAKYYEMAKQERENHARVNPGWSAKDNYAVCGKKKRRKKEKSDGKSQLSKTPPTIPIASFSFLVNDRAKEMPSNIWDRSNGRMVQALQVSRRMDCHI